LAHIFSPERREGRENSYPRRCNFFSAVVYFYFYAGPVPYPFLEALEAGPHTATVVAMAAGLPALHVVYVAASRVLKCRSAVSCV